MHGQKTVTRTLETEQGATKPPGADLPVVLRKARSAWIRLRAKVRSQMYGFSPSTIYDDAFFESEACLMTDRYADAIVGVMVRYFEPSSVFDFGAGRGSLLQAFHHLGVEVSGCEGSRSGVRLGPKDVLIFQADLKQPVVLSRTYDLVTCIEVAEHIPRRAATTLVDSIAAAAQRRVLFSASGPGDPGEDHINLQPPEYWLALFARHGFRHEAGISRELCDELREVGAPQWYDNSLVLER